ILVVEALQGIQQPARFMARWLVSRLEAALQTQRLVGNILKDWTLCMPGRRDDLRFAFAPRLAIRIAAVEFFLVILVLVVPHCQCPFSASYQNWNQTLHARWPI